MGHGVRRFDDLRAWQECYRYKNAVYAVCETTTLATDWRRREQLEKSVAGPPAHVAEAFGRFHPADSAKFAAYARASLMESQNHLRDAVDRKHITEEKRIELNAMAEIALQEVTGWLDYLQSPEALRNARRARERRIASRPERMKSRKPRATNPEPPNPEPPNPEHRTHEHRTQNQNREPRTRNRTENTNQEP